MEYKELTMTPEEEGTFYQSGLVASGCLELIDEYMHQSIIRYGRKLKLDVYKEMRGELDSLVHQNAAQAAIIENLKKEIQK